MGGGRYFAAPLFANAGGPRKERCYGYLHRYCGVGGCMDTAALRRGFLIALQSAIVRRIAYVVVASVVASLFGCGEARAYGFVGKTGGGPTDVFSVSSTTGGGTYSTAQGACNAILAYRQSTSGACGNGVVPTLSIAACYSHNPPNAYRVDLNTTNCPPATGTSYFRSDFFSRSTTTAPLTCPEFSEESAPATTPPCRCLSGYKDVGAACVAIGLCGAVVDGLNALAEPVKSGGTPGSLSACYGGCSISGDFGGQGSANSWWLFGPFASSGGNCEPADGSGSNVEEPPVPCPKGQCPGTVNGTAVCVACFSTSSPEGTTTKTNPDGTITTTTRETTCTGADCTTTTTTTTRDAGGVVVGTPTTETEKERTDSFCEENPQSPLCKDSSFGGACGAGFSCDGDAVQCAIAREQHVRNCRLFDEATPLSTIGTEAATGEAQPVGHPGLTPAEIDMSNRIDQSNPYGGSCPGDLPVTLMGTTHMIPLSGACTPLTVMGYIAVAISLLVAARIVMEAV